MTLFRRILFITRALVICLLATRCQARRETHAHPSNSTVLDGDNLGFPVNDTDEVGRIVVVRSEPKRIIALLPSHTETLFALGVGDRLIGVDDYSNFPTSALRLPKLGGLYDVHLEALAMLRPDLVLGSDKSPATAALEQLGITVWSATAQRYDDVFDMIVRTGKLVGRRRQAEALVKQTQLDIERIEKALEGTARVSVYYELDPTPYAVGPKSFVGVLLSKAGGENVIPSTLGEFPKINPELIAAANPGVILGASLADISKRPGWSSLRAVRDGRVFSLTPEEREVVVRPGPRLASGVRVLAHILHPEVSL